MRVWKEIIKREKEKIINVNVKESWWYELNKRKKEGESVHDVIERLLQREMSLYVIIKKCKTVAELNR